MKQKLVLGLMVILVGVMIHSRYGQLKMQRRLCMYFRNAGQVLSQLRAPVEMQMGLEIPTEIKEKPGNVIHDLIPFLKDTPPKYTLNPVSASPAALLDIRYGEVQHPVPLKSTMQYIPGKQLWFCFAPGPLGMAPAVEITEPTPLHRIYRFLSMPYNLTNGIQSEGYLFADSRGIRFGEFKY